MKRGRKLHDQIDEAIRIYDKLLIVLSEAGMASERVVTEIRKARKREGSDKRQVLSKLKPQATTVVLQLAPFLVRSSFRTRNVFRSSFVPHEERSSFATAFLIYCNRKVSGGQRQKLDMESCIHWSSTRATMVQTCGWHAARKR